MMDPGSTYAKESDVPDHPIIGFSRKPRGCTPGLTITRKSTLKRCRPFAELSSGSLSAASRDKGCHQPVSRYRQTPANVISNTLCG